MTKEYQQLYKEHGELYLNGYRSLKDSANPAENKLNLFRLTYCAWFYAMENCIILREHIRASDTTVEMERVYSIRRMLALDQGTL